MLFSRKDLSFIILPLLLEQLLNVTVGMFDSMMVSSVGEAAVSGVSLVLPINLLLNIVFTAISTGGLVVCSQLLGQKSYKDAREVAKQLCYLNFFLSLFISFFALVSRKPLLSLCFGSVEADVMASAEMYFLITALCYPFNALTVSSSAVFRAMGNTKITLFISLGSNIINIIGNAIFIYIFDLGVAGAAIATLVSVMCGAVVNIALLCKPKFMIFLENPLQYRPNSMMIRKILRIGVPSGIETGLFQFGKLLTQSLVSSLGTTAIAANMVGNQITSLEDALGTAVGLSTVTVVGRCIGAGECEQAKQYSKKLVCIGYAVLSTMAVLLSLLAKPIIGIYNLSADASALTFELVILYNLLTSILWPLSFVLPYVFRAASDVKYTTVVSIASMWLSRVALSYVFVLLFDFGLTGVWLAMFADWLVRTVLFVPRFLSNKWMEKYKFT